MAKKTVNKEYVKELLKNMGFKPITGKLNIYSKSYSFNTKVYNIDVDFENSQINYPTEIRRGRDTTINFANPENFVVLECVNHLLSIGYTPEHLYLEQPAARGGEYLDIVIYNEDASNNCKSGQYAIIECKTYGQKYDKALKELTDPSKTDPQLLDYGHQFKSVSMLCLYSSLYNMESKDISREITIIKFTEEMKNATNTAELKNAWTGITSSSGLFNRKPYQYNSFLRNYDDLIEIEEGAGKKLYNDFAKILRKHVISDKSNAYNKLFNLFLCKIVDEEASHRPDLPNLKFQVDESEDSVSFMKKLYDLYKLGMKQFLSKDVVDYSDAELNRFGDLHQSVMRMIDEIRLFKNGEFSFIDVYSRDSFEENCKIVKEVVALLQDYKLKYTHKHPYLGLFFENLLNSGFKQESGQYFTPIPIAHFIVSSLPIKEMIELKMKNGDSSFLPFTIDYACGSGHFLTEGMDEIQKSIAEIFQKSNNISATQKRRLESYITDEYSWAKDFIYGIDLDYRLVKTTKVSTFLNGDGEANIIHANGLAKFNSKEYINLLHSDSEDNGNFDILLANPPYTVQNFKQTIIDGEQRFSLFKHLGKNSDDIECLFVERIGQLIKEDGYIGVILPTSILESQKIFTKTRKYIIDNFRIIGIVRLSDQAFMKTGTKTFVLFLEKRAPKEKDILLKSIKNALSGNMIRDFSYLEISHVIESFTKDAMGLKKSQDLNYIIKDENKKAFVEMIYTYAITKMQNVVVVDAGEGDEAKNFLGFDFTERRGKEGIQEKYIGIDERRIDSKLFAQEKINEEKVNYYIYKNFLNQEITEIHPSLKKNLYMSRLSDLIPFELEKGKYFNSFIYTNMNELNRLLNIKSCFPIEQVRYYLPDSIKKGTSITRDKTTPGKYNVVAGGKMPAYKHNKFNREADIITVSASGANAGFVNYYEEPIFASDCFTIESRDKTKLKYLFYVLKARQEDIYKFAKGNGQPHVYDNTIYKMTIPVPEDENLINSIINECNKIFAQTEIKEEVRDSRLKEYIYETLKIKYED